MKCQSERIKVCFQRHPYCKVPFRGSLLTQQILNLWDSDAPEFSSCSKTTLLRLLNDANCLLAGLWCGLSLFTLSSSNVKYTAWQLLLVDVDVKQMDISNPSSHPAFKFTASAPLFFYYFILSVFFKGLRETTLHRKTSFMPKSSFKGGFKLQMRVFGWFVCIFALICELLIGCWISVINPSHRPMSNLTF